MGFDIGGPQYGLRDGKIGEWQGDGSYDNVTDVFSIQVMSIRGEVTSADLDGDDGITATASRLKKGTVTLKMGSIHMDAIGMFLPGTSGESGAPGSTRKVLTISNRRAPYIGAAGQSMAEEGSGDTQFFVPKMKVSQPFELKFENDTFSIPEIQFTAVLDENFEDEDGNPALFHIIENETAGTITTLPPTGVYVAV
jgi:hypothetical protein